MERKKTSHARLLRAVTLSERLIVRRLERALLNEGEIDALLDFCAEFAKKAGATEKEKKELFSKIESLRCEDLSKLVGLIGMLCEKEALLSGAPSTAGAEAPVVCRFEDL